jgi:hypothetical protein
MALLPPNREVLEGDVILKRHEDGRVEILQASPTARMSLEMLAQHADRHVVRLSGNRIVLAGQVTYRIVGWDDHASALLLERDTPGSGPGPYPPATTSFPPGAGTKGA